MSGLRDVAEKLRLLIIEDKPVEAELMARALAKRFALDWIRVETEADYMAALDPVPDVILSDYRLPLFDGERALMLLRASELSVPFILVTGSIGEERAIDMIRMGADDYLLKDRLDRLLPAVERVLREGAERTARRKAEGELEALREQLKSIVSSLPDVVWSAAFPSNRMLYVSNASATVFGWSPEDFYSGRAVWRDLIHPEDRTRMMKGWEDAGQSERYESEYRIVKPGGEVRWIQTRGRRLVDARGNVERIDGIARDITERVADQQRLRYLAYYDPLTGLANRTLLLKWLADHMAQPDGQAPPVGLCIFNVERFKTVNDAFGRQVGDSLLTQVGQRLRSLARHPDHLARLEADRFALIVPAPKEDDVIELLELAYRRVDGDPYLVEGIELRISTRVGVALFPIDGTDAETLYRNAEAALKKSGAGDRLLFYAKRMTEHIAEKLSLEYKLRQALENDEFVLHYQPKVDATTRRVTGVEALIRWQNAKLGLVPPLKFIPLMEETGLIMQVGLWALQRATLDHRRWAEHTWGAPRIAVNVSPIQLRQRNFVDVLKRAIAAGSAPPCIDLEITETAVMEDIESNTAKLIAIRDLGVSIAIDDFGTGYSSLGYLTKLPVQFLKIDRSFIMTMDSDPDALAVVSTIISLAHSVRLKVVAEGVETERQAQLLEHLGCDELQGYLISRPIPATEIERTICNPLRRGLDDDESAARDFADEG